MSRFLKKLRPIFYLYLFFFAVSFIHAAAEKEQKREIIIWTYDSFVSEWGPAKAVSEAFYRASGINARFVSQGDGGALLSKLLLEGSKASADIALGIDNNLAKKALESDLFLSYKPSGADKLSSDLIIDSEFRLTAYDYGYFSIIYDSDRVSQAPKSLEDLTRPEWNKALILMDPRTSTPGLGFFSWVKTIYGSTWRDYWQRLLPSILTITEGWDSGYGLFTAGEAPLVLSYTTSPAYHVEYEETERYQAAIFEEGHCAQIEAAGILASSDNIEAAKAFIDFMLKEEFQTLLPLTNWMYPVIPIELPSSYRLAPKPSKNLTAKETTADDLDQWTRLIAGQSNK